MDTLKSQKFDISWDREEDTYYCVTENYTDTSGEQAGVGDTPEAALTHWNELNPLALTTGEKNV